MRSRARSRRGSACRASPARAPAGTDAAIDAIAKDLAAHRGRSIVIAGDAQPPSVHALAHAMNEALGNAGQTVTYTATPEAVPSEQLADLRALVSDMDAGRVQMLLHHRRVESGADGAGRPELRRRAWPRCRMRAHSGLFLDETAMLCHWHVPGTHYLEAWSDARTIDGTASIVQPLIQPMYGGKSAHEVLATLSDRRTAPATTSSASSGWPAAGLQPTPPRSRRPGAAGCTTALIPGTAHATEGGDAGAATWPSALPPPPA